MIIGFKERLDFVPVSSQEYCVEAISTPVRSPAQGEPSEKLR